MVRNLVLAVAMAGCVTTAGEGDHDPSKDDQNHKLHVLAQIDVGGEADWMGVGFGSLWVPTPDGQLLRIDPQSLSVVARIPIGASPYRGVAIGSDAVYIPNTGDDTISKVDPATNTVIATLPAMLHGDSEGAIGVTTDGLWLVTEPGDVDRDAELSKLDPTTGAVLATVAVPGDSHGVAIEGGSAWVTSFANNAVAQVDLASASRVSTIPVEAGPRFLTTGEGAVWVLCQGMGRVTRIDVASAKVAGVIEVNAPGFGGDISYGEGAVWITTFGKPAGKIDTHTNELVEQYVEEGFGDAIRAGLGKLWISGSAVFAVEVPG